MTRCPHHLRPELPPRPARIAALPVDVRGYPVPFFAGWVGSDGRQCPRGQGEPEFRLVDTSAFVECVRFRHCWICGQELGRHLAFVAGPMCTITRTSVEPPSHLDCALFALKACPFMLRPHMVRREDERTAACAGNSAGLTIRRNPGVFALWLTRGYKVFPDPAGKPLIEMGEPQALAWWREGRTATRAEILESITSGLPSLEALCESPDDLVELHRRRDALIAAHLP